MAMYLSASAIKDFWSCPRRYYYRVYRSKEGIPSNHMVLGKIVHDAIELVEKNEINEKEIIDWALGQWDLKVEEIGRYWKSTKPPKNITRLLTNYLTKIRPRLTEPAEIELDFRLSLFDDVYFIGKMDRVEERIVYDWKTSRNSPTRFELRDVQFSLYALAYRQVFGTDLDAFYYGHLPSGRCYPVDINPELLTDAKLLLDKTAKMVYNMRKDSIQHEISYRFNRLPGRLCDWCLYRGICDRELDVIDS
jgi:CRISPR/Cas system-associated exonuclease Cas4 (RecB family)